MRRQPSPVAGWLLLAAVVIALTVLILFLGDLVGHLAG